MINHSYPRTVLLLLILSIFSVGHKSLGSNLPEKQNFNIETLKNTLDTSTNNFFLELQDQKIPFSPDKFSTRETIVKYISDTSYYPEIENINLCKDDNSKQFTVCDITHTLKNRLHVKGKSLLKIDKAKLRKYLETLNAENKNTTRNAKLRADTNGTIIVTEKEKYGYKINVNKILSNIPRYFGELPQKKIIPLPADLSAPEITSTNYKEIGLREIIGKGESNFRGSPKNRIHNIHVATSRFEGILVPPQETFSFVDNLGPVDGETGYKKELVIKNNKTIPEFGGGVCQVSTTLFRAAVKTGLEITERRNHAYPVQYYSPQGTDATVYIPKPDLQFKNNTPGYILIQPHFDGTILSFDIIGTSDGREVTTEGPTLLKRTPNGGRKYVWWQIVNDKNGNQISKKGFWSFYQNVARFHSNHKTQLLPGKPKSWSTKEWRKYKREHGM